MKVNETAARRMFAALGHSNAQGRPNETWNAYRLRLKLNTLYEHLNREPVLKQDRDLRDSILDTLDRGEDIELEGHEIEQVAQVSPALPAPRKDGRKPRGGRGTRS
jgi:hypothetical protein